MSYPFNYPTPTNANVQIFYAIKPSSAGYTLQSWVKPQGASFVWITLIAGGGGGAGYDGVSSGGGGGSAAVVNCMVPAFLIPDILTLRIGAGGKGGAAGGGSGASGEASQIYYNTQTGSLLGYLLLTSNPGTGGSPGTVGSGGVASSSNNFSCMGFFQSIAGQAGSTSNLTASATTFLSGGGATTSIVANYGTSTLLDGYFQFSPIIVGVGGGSSNLLKGGKAGIGCGGGGVFNSTGLTGGDGGNGLCVIITW